MLQEIHQDNTYYAPVLDKKLFSCNIIPVMKATGFASSAKRQNHRSDQKKIYEKSRTHRQLKLLLYPIQENISEG